MDSNSLCLNGEMRNFSHATNLRLWLIAMFGLAFILAVAFQEKSSSIISTIKAPIIGAFIVFYIMKGIDFWQKAQKLVILQVEIKRHFFSNRK